jgi:outer membrane cobalamin receptor
MTKGIEFGFKTFINSYLTDSINYNLIEAIDLTTKKRLPRRAENQINHRLTYSNDNQKIEFENVFKSGRADINNSNKSVQLKKYVIMNIYYEFLYKENLSFNSTVKNIFKSSYQEIWGYNNGGRVLTLGLDYKF